MGLYFRGTTVSAVWGTAGRGGLENGGPVKRPVTWAGDLQWDRERGPDNGSVAQAGKQGTCLLQMEGP